MSLGVLLFIVALLIVIMVHEAGHFVAAKLLGFKATKFFVGFGPTLWSFKKGETEYGVKLFPAGGFVKIVGMNPYEEVAPEDEPRAYANRPRWQRAVMIAAGPATHWPLAFIVLAVGAMTVGFPTGEVTNVVNRVESNVFGTRTPAFEAGIVPGDEITHVNGQETSTWEETRQEIRRNAGEATTFTFMRDGSEKEVTIPLGTATFDESGNLVDYAPPGSDVESQDGHKAVGFLGVEPAVARETMGIFEASTFSAGVVGEFTVESVKNMGQPFMQVFNGDLWEALTESGPREGTDSPVGVVGAGRVAGEVFESGLYERFITFMVGLTIFVGLINLLPLPPLDGGHLAVLGYEAVTRRTVDIRKLIPIAAAVISFFVLLFFAVLYLDLARPLQVPL